MTLQDIIDLTKAGYTKEDIAKLTQAEAPKPEAPKPVSDPPEAVQDQKPVPQEDTALSAIQNQIDALKQMMQLNNMLTVNQTEAPKQRTVDDIFAEIINPPVKENK